MTQTRSDVQTGWDSPVLTLTDRAREQIIAVMDANEARDHSLRVGIMGRRGGQFHYNMELIPPDEVAADDVQLRFGEVTIVVDGRSIPHLKGSTVDFIEKPENPSGGFEIENPNPLWPDDRTRAVASIIDDQINPQVASHGGFVELIDVDGATVYVQLGGGCQGCGMANVTLKQGIEVMLKEQFPEIEHVIDTTDHASGTNPYYQPAKK